METETLDLDTLSAALRSATSTVDAPPGFTEKVHRGARRRQLRRRYRVSAIALVVLTVGAGLAVSAHRWVPVVTGSHGAAVPNDDQRLHDSTRGDLAGDHAFVAEVGAVWKGGLNLGPGRSPTGPANVYWAGNTPAGPAAVVLQHVSWTAAAGQQARTVVQIGLVATSVATSTLSVLATRTLGDADGTDESFAFGLDDSVVLTMAESGFTVYSPAPTVNPGTGKVTRYWTDLRYADGVAVFDASAAQGEGYSVVELPRRPDADHDYLPRPGQPSPYRPVLVAGSSLNDPRLPWPVMVGLNGAPDGAPGTNPPSWSQVFDDALHSGGYTDPYVPHPPNHSVPGIADRDSESYWQVACALPGGNTVIVGEELVGVTGRLYAVTVDQRLHVLGVAYGGSIDPTSPLPVRVRLPGGNGWLVAAYGSLISAQTNLDEAAESAVALAPAGTVLAVVPDGQPSGGQPFTVTLNP